MKISIWVSDKGEEKKILESNYIYSEGQSRQEGKPSFFIYADGGKGDEYEIHFHADKTEEIDKLIRDLQEIRANFKNRF